MSILLVSSYLTAIELWSRMRDHLKNFFGGNYITSLVIGFRRRPVKRWKADYVLHSILSSDLTRNLLLGNTDCLLLHAQKKFLKSVAFPSENRVFGLSRFRARERQPWNRYAAVLA